MALGIIFRIVLGLSYLILDISYCIVHLLKAGSIRVLGKFWKVMGIKIAIFEDLQSFGRDRIFKMEKFWMFVWKNSENILKWMYLSFVLNTLYARFAHFTIYDAKHNPPKNYRYIVKNSVLVLLWGSKCK